MMYNYNLHTHTLLSDGALLPSEVAMRYMAIGYKAIAITDHADYSNIEFIVRAALVFSRQWLKAKMPIQVLPGVELTHLPPEQFAPLVKYARKEGIKVIIGHGETVVEPVVKGTNRAALEAGIDILAHPGLITGEDAKLAAKRGVFLEITARSGHCGTNTHVVKAGLAAGARMILNNDSHSPEDIIAPDQLLQVGYKAGLSKEQLEDIYREVAVFLKVR